MLRILWIILAAALVLLGLSFAMLNPAEVTLNLYAGRVTLPAAVWIVLALAVGAVLGVLSTAGVMLRQRRELARVRRRADEANKELAELRKVPIRNQP